MLRRDRPRGPDPRKAAARRSDAGPCGRETAGEGIRLRPAAVPHQPGPPQGGQGASLAAPGPSLRPRGRGPRLRRAPGGVGGAGPPGLRRGRVQRAPHLALRAHELAQPHGRRRLAADQTPEAPHLRERPAHPRSAPPGRRAGHARLHVQWPHHRRLRPGIPREYRVYGVPMPESRARFEEAFEIVRGLWTEEVFSYRGRFWSYQDVAIWPRPVQRPHPPVWIPVTTSKETIEWAAERDLPITPGLVGGGLREDIVRYYARCLARHGRRITPGHLILSVDAYVADSKEQAVREAGPHLLYFSRTLFSHGNITEANLQRDAGYLSPAALDYVRPENLPAAMRAREEYRDMTMEQVARLAEGRPWGSPEEVRDRIIAEADAVGADTVLVHLNRGDMPHEMFLAQIRRFAAEVLPALQAHEVRTVPVAADLTPGRV